jgi:hypothetical protein
MKYATVADLFEAVRDALARSKCPERCANERAFEEAVWRCVRELVCNGGGDPASVCLTSHTWAEGRSEQAWRDFCAHARGADVEVLDSRNRLDIVLRHPTGGTIGIEVKCLGQKGHAAKLTQGIGQAMLALAHRDHTLLVIHCGTVGREQTERPRGIASTIAAPPRMEIVVLPHAESRR